jgi:adenylate cyclase
MHGQEQTRVRKHNRSAALPWHICVSQVYRIGAILPSVLQSWITDPTGVPMPVNTRRRLRTAFLLMLVCVPVALCYEFVESTLAEDVEGKISFVGLIIGIVLALPLALFEESRFDERMRRLPFAVAVIVKSLAYIGSLLAVFMTTGLLAGLLQGLQMQDFWTSVTELDYYLQTAVGFVLYIIIVFFRQLDRLLGPGMLLRYMVGKYHRPRLEARIFMFLDLKSSTALGEELDRETYYGLVNEFFRDISGPVLDRDGEIYEYVGDEAVITWKEDLGIKDANCIGVFFDIDRVIEKKRQSYLDRFGVAPEYKAGVHMGEVVAAEIGDLKKALVFNGDVLNTGARIQGECGRLEKRLLSSAALFNRLTLPEGWTAEEMGPTNLRGKSTPVELVAFA